MGRRAKSPKGKAKKAKRPLALKPPKDEGTRVRDLERRLAEALEQLQTRHDELAEALKREAEALEQQTATAEILRVISRSPTDVRPVFEAIVHSGLRLFPGAAVSIALPDGEMMHVVAEGDPQRAAFWRHRSFPLTREYMHSAAILDRTVVDVPDVAQAPAEWAAGSRNFLASGYRSITIMPMMRGDEAIGALSVVRLSAGPLSDKQHAVLKTFADQAVIAIQNARLFREIEDKSRQLELASQHKSEFLANMSHELRTPLNAIIGYSELLEEDAADLDGGRLVPDLQKIATAAKHQLSLINDILDLSKVEAGRMELEATDFDLPSAIDNALMLVRERATRRGLTLGRTIDERLGMLHGDERKVKQVLLNLLSNALKFTPEGGRIDVSAGVHDEVAEVSVTDTGVGIAPEDQGAVFEEFRQVGTADKKVEGTGLGLALSRKFIELHGGRIWVESEVGKGSTFTFTLPVRREK